MSHSTEVFRSLLSSTLQQGRGIASKGHSNRPEEPLELYDMEGCPFCRLVREALTDLDLDVMVFPCPGRTAGRQTAVSLSDGPQHRRSPV